MWWRLSLGRSSQQPSNNTAPHEGGSGGLTLWDAEHERGKRWKDGGEEEERKQQRGPRENEDWLGELD